jgi:putative NADH-flavin reductase
MYALHYVYHDLDLACQYYKLVADAGDKRLLNYIYVDPPSIHDSGSKPTGYEFISDVAAKPPSQSISYADLGAAFVEIADRQEAFRGQAVIVSATGKVEEHWLPLFGNMLMRLKSRIIG